MAIRALEAKCGYLEETVVELVQDRVEARCRDKMIQKRFLHKPDDLTLD